MKPWTTTDIRLARSLSTSHTIAQLAEKLGRKYFAVWRLVHLNGIRCVRAKWRERRAASIRGRQ